MTNKYLEKISANRFVEYQRKQNPSQVFGMTNKGVMDAYNLGNEQFKVRDGGSFQGRMKRQYDPQAVAQGKVRPGTTPSRMVPINEKMRSTGDILGSSTAQDRLAKIRANSAKGISYNKPIVSGAGGSTIPGAKPKLGNLPPVEAPRGGVFSKVVELAKKHPIGAAAAGGAALLGAGYLAGRRREPQYPQYQ